MPKAIVRYKQVRALNRYAPYVARQSPYVAGAIRAYGAYQTAKPYVKGVMRLRSAFMRNRANARKKRKFRQAIGESVGTGTAKQRTEKSTTLTNLPAKQLVQKELVDIPKTTTNSIDSRQRDMVNLRGIKICFMIKNNHTDGIPCYFNWAIITPKALDTGATGVPTTDFFRGEGNARGQDFTNTLDWLDLYCRNINTDKYQIHTRQRHRIAGVWNAQDNAPTTTNDKVNVGLAGERMIEKYIPINRQMRWNDTVHPEKNIYMVWWCSFSDDTTVSYAQYQYRITCYFKEPKN